MYTHAYNLIHTYISPTVLSTVSPTVLSTQQLSRLNTESVCTANGLRHAVFTDTHAVFLADSVRLCRGTTFIQCIYIPTHPHPPFTHIHTHILTKYRVCSPKAIKARFGFFHDFLYN